MLLLSRDQDDARFAPTVVLRWAGGVLRRPAPGGKMVMRDGWPIQYHAERPLCEQRSSCRIALCCDVGGVEDEFPKWERLRMLRKAL